MHEQIDIAADLGPMAPCTLAECVCCGEPGQMGRYEGLPVCFPCYETGLLREWLDQHRNREESP